MYWESPSDAIVARLRHRTHRHDADPYSSTSPAMQVQDGPYTDDADRGVVDEDTGNDAGILKMNASLVQGWETLAFNKLELERGPGEAKMIMHLLDVSNAIPYVIVPELIFLQSYFCWRE